MKNANAKKLKVEKPIFTWWPEDEDPDDLQFQWDEFIADFTQQMQTKNPDGNWDVVVKNFGWMKQCGIKELNDITTGSDLLAEILPNTECHFKIYHHQDDGFKINNFHHDSPYGSEWYYVLPKGDVNEEG